MSFPTEAVVTLGRFWQGFATFFVIAFYEGDQGREKSNVFKAEGPQKHSGPGLPAGMKTDGETMSVCGGHFYRLHEFISWGTQAERSCNSAHLLTHFLRPSWSHAWSNQGASTLPGFCVWQEGTAIIKEKPSFRLRANCFTQMISFNPHSVL